MQIIAYREAIICVFYLLLLEAARLEDLAGRLAVRLEDRFAAAFFTRFAIICLLNLLVFLS